MWSFRITKNVYILHDVDRYEVFYRRISHILTANTKRSKFDMQLCFDGLTMKRVTTLINPIVVVKPQDKNTTKRRKISNLRLLFDRRCDQVQEKVVP